MISKSAISYLKCRPTIFLSVSAWFPDLIMEKGLKFFLERHLGEYQSYPKLSNTLGSRHRVERG